MRRALLLLAALAAAAGCERKRPYPPPERYLPADAAVSVSVPALGSAARQVGALYRTVAPAPPAAQLADAYAAVRSQLGFDPLDPRGLEQAGVDPGGSAAAALGGGRTPLLVLPILDLARFDATAARLARDRMGAAERIARKARGIEIVVFRRDAAAGAALAYAAVGPHALLAAGSQAPDVVLAAATLPEESSLAKSPLWPRARAAVGDGYLATAFAPPGSPSSAGFALLRDGAALGVRASATSLGLRLALLLSPDREAFWKGIAASGAPPAPDETGRLTPEAVLVGRWAGDPAGAFRRAWPLLPPGVARSLAAVHIDPERELLPAIAPGPAVALAVAPSFTLADFSSGFLDARRVDPFRLVELEAVLPVRDPAAVTSFVDRLRKAGKRLGVDVAPRGPSGYTVAFGKARLGLELAGGRLLVAGPAEKLPALAARAPGSGYRAAGEAARQALSTGMGGAVLDVAHLSRAIEALPQEAYGTGPSAVVMHSLVSRYLDPAAALSAVSLRLDLAPGAALLDLEVAGREAPPSKP
ncbi:MAG TPA: hypothetical protein VMT17_12800 [Anaeromyxobacteraceae bacterium]|nr:hypothetical protein [Anaeromyxobacteraceae bacterium]